MWVASEDDKIALIQDETTPFFTTPHFNGHLSVLVRGSRIGDCVARVARFRMGRCVYGGAGGHRACRVEPLAKPFEKRLKHG